MSRLSRRRFLYAGAAAATAAGLVYLTKNQWYPSNLNATSPTSSPSPTLTEHSEPTSPTPTTRLPPGQHEISAILRWNIDHPGIIPQNPRLDLESWRLAVEGEIRNPKALAWNDFLNLQSIESISDFHCVEGWSVRNCKWYGVPFKFLADSVEPTSDSKYVHFVCADGYATSLELREVLKDNVILAYRLNDQPLEESLGGPMRLVIPDKYGYKNAMWVQKINFTKTRKQGFWESQGYSDTADVLADDRFAR